jgi:hypothetical protein
MQTVNFIKEVFFQLKSPIPKNLFKSLKPKILKLK